MTVSIPGAADPGTGDPGTADPGARGSVGVIGLGNMGAELARNLVGSGFDVIAFDTAGPSRNVEGATFADGVASLATRCRVVVLSLPDAAASLAVARSLATSEGRMCAYVVDTSTVGVDASRSIGTLLSEAGVGYVDAPVSGGAAGARARTLAVMYSGSDDVCAAVMPVIEGLSDRRFRVGAEPGLAQAVKLANNFLSATALAAASEAVSFATSAGVDIEVLLSIVNASSGQSAATSDKFVNHVATGRYASGFTSSLMAKDVRLYLDSVRSTDGPSAFGSLTVDTWERFAAEHPGVDFTRIYPFVSGSDKVPA